MIYFIVLIIAGFLNAAKLPSYITPCKISDPDVNKCALENGKKALPSIFNGDESLKLPSFKPFYLHEIILNTGESLKIKFNEVSIEGMEGTILNEIKVDGGEKKIFINFTLPKADLKAQYEIDGKILVLPIKGQGPCDITFEEMHVMYEIDYEIITKKGTEYLKAINTVLTYEAKQIHYSFENLFNGDKKLGDEMNKFLNENWKEINEEVGPAVQESMKAIGLTLFNGLTRVPYKELFIVD